MLIVGRTKWHAMTVAVETNVSAVQFDDFPSPNRNTILLNRVVIPHRGRYGLGVGCSWSLRSRNVIQSGILTESVLNVPRCANCSYASRQ